MRVGLRIAILVGIPLIVSLSTYLVYLNYFLPDIPLPEKIELPQSSDRIENGRYLAHSVAVCMDCHSTRDWNRWSGPIVKGTLGKGGERFGPEMNMPGIFYASNITPSELSSWTNEELFRAVACGVNKRGQALLPVMPYEHYGKMAEADLLDILAYIRTLDPIENKTPEREIDFPVNFLINNMPKPAELRVKPDASDTLAYGEYIFNMANCGECHTPRKNKLPDMDLYAAGGLPFDMGNGIVRSTNITFDEATGLGSWNYNTFMRQFKMYDYDREAYIETPLPEGRVNSPMPWSMYASMTKEDLTAIWFYLQSLPPIFNKVEKYEKKN